MYHHLFGIMSVPWSCYLMTKAAGQSALQGPAGGGVLASSYNPVNIVLKVKP